MIKILIIEDNLDDMQLLRRKLDRSDTSFDVSEAMTLAEAENLLSSKNFDAVLIDLSLTDSQREDTMLAVKRFAHGSALVVFSGYDEPDFITRTIRQNASGYLIKGRDEKNPDAFAAAIRTAIKTKEACVEASEL